MVTADMCSCLTEDGCSCGETCTCEGCGCVDCAGGIMECCECCENCACGTNPAEICC